MAMTGAERMRRARAKVQAGRCQTCLGKRKCMPRKTICRKCNEEAKARVYRSRGIEPAEGQ